MAEKKYFFTDGQGVHLTFNAGLLIESLIALGFVIALVMLAKKKIPHTGGTVLKYHAIFVTTAILVVVILPTAVDQRVFSPIGIRVVGTIYPLYHSIVAVCSVSVLDDKIWLQYWIAQGFVFYLGEYLENFATKNEVVYNIFFPIEFFFYLWLLLPYTDGAGLLYEKITKPYLAPSVEPLVACFSNWLNVLLSASISMVHIYVVVLVLVFLPEALQRFVAISLGVIYPLSASIVAALTEHLEDDTFWLTYWCCFGVLFLFMDWTEEYLGFIPGYYIAVIFAELYLMIPIVNGADKVFRKVLVPLAGQHKMLVLRDAVLVKKAMLQNIHEKHHKNLKKRIVELFHEDEIDEELNSSEVEDTSLSDLYKTENDKLQKMLRKTRIASQTTSAADVESPSTPLL